MTAQFLSALQQRLIWLQIVLQQFVQQQQEQVALWLLVLVSMAAGGLLYRGVAAAWRNWKMRRRFKRGQLAEKNAVRFLRRHGYRILAAQLEEPITVYVDGEPQKTTVRADFLVRKGWKTYVVEVKSGQQGTVKLAGVRRQLLEYKLVYQPDGILLLDMEHHNLQQIRFAYTTRQHRMWLRYGVISVATGLLVYGFMQII